MLIMNLQNLKQENAMLLVIKITQTIVKEMKIVQPLNLKPKSLNQVFVIIQTHPNGHISIDTPSIRSRNSTWKVRRNYINSEGRIHVEIITSIRRGFDFQSRGYIDQISTWIFPCCFDVKSMQLLYLLFHSIIFQHFLLWEPILNYSGIILSHCNFNDIDVITDFGTIGTISFGNIATMQINRNNDKFYFLQNNTNRDYNANITKNNTYLLQNNTNQSF